MIYRPELDGLRAIAIIPVILFHFGATWLPGGFLGVDIFFVISGYLITSIISKEIEDERFTLAIFYERRIKRIIPTLLVVLAVTYTVAALTVSPFKLKDLSQEIVAAATFLSNMYYAITVDYFSSKAEETFLLHTWSLAVEEQFYILFPLLLMMNKAKNSRLLIFVVLTVLSFFLAVTLSYSDKDFNFYFIGTRAWELLIGALVALNYSQLSQVSIAIRNTISVLGFLVLLISFFIFTKELQHPGFWTIFPVSSVALIIAFADKTMMAKMLSWKVLRGVGLISYSLYLWHQPVLAFILIKYGMEHSALAGMIAAFATLILSLITYYYVEKPFRRIRISNTVTLFVVTAGMLTIVSVVGLLGHINNGWPNRFSEKLNFNSMTISPKRYECHTSGANFLPPSQGCILGRSKKPTFAVFGDSHGVELSFALAKSEIGFKGVKQLTFSACAPLIHDNNKTLGCSNWLRQSLVYISSEKSIQTVFLVFRLPYHISTYSKEINKVSAFLEDYKRLIAQLLASGKEVVLVYPVPELPLSAEKLIVPFSIFSDIPNVVYGETNAEYWNRNAKIVEQLNIIVDELDNGRLFLLNPYDAFCDMSNCKAMKNGKAFYFDDNHLSLGGADVLVEEYLKRFR